MRQRGAKRQHRCNKTQWLDVNGRRKCVNECAVKGYHKVLKGSVEALDGEEKVIKLRCDGLTGESKVTE